MSVAIVIIGHLVITVTKLIMQRQSVNAMEHLSSVVSVPCTEMTPILCELTWCVLVMAF